MSSLASPGNIILEMPGRAGLGSPRAGPGLTGGGRGGSDLAVAGGFCLTATLADISMRVYHLMSLLGSCQVISLNISVCNRLIFDELSRPVLSVSSSLNSIEAWCA